MKEYFRVYRLVRAPPRKVHVSSMLSIVEIFDIDKLFLTITVIIKGRQLCGNIFRRDTLQILTFEDEYYPQGYKQNSHNYDCPIGEKYPIKYLGGF